MEKLALTHLRALEAESIHILRGVVAEFAKLRDRFTREIGAEILPPTALGCASARA